MTNKPDAESERAAHRAAVDAGYASLDGYIERWGKQPVGKLKMNPPIEFIEAICAFGRIVETIGIVLCLPGLVAIAIAHVIGRIGGALWNRAKGRGLER